eukprot:g42322.t1
MGGEGSKAESKPISLSFTATDGTKVDLEEYKGKVVLLDFWATWCPPCVGEVPNLVAAHKQYKDKGFAIIGISLDENKAAMEKFTKQHEMTWPQYFDGLGWNNKIIGRFGIRSIPAMWLIDKEGKLITTNARGRSLHSHLAKLLT